MGLGGRRASGARRGRRAVAVGFYKGTRKLVSLVTPPIISTPWLGEGGPGF